MSDHNFKLESFSVPNCICCKSKAEVLIRVVTKFGEPAMSWACKDHEPVAATHAMQLARVPFEMTERELEDE